MNHAATLTIGLLMGFTLEPVVTRPSSNRIVVEGVELAGLQPEAGVVEGVELISGYAWNQDGRVVFEVDPLGDYEVHTFEPEVDGERPYAVELLQADRDDLIDNIVFNRIFWEREFNNMMGGAHPDFDGPVNFFELGESLDRVQPQLNIP